MKNRIVIWKPADRNSRQSPADSAGADAEALPKITLLPIVRDAMLPIAIYVYFAGFVYIYFFYQAFGISISVMDVPINYFFVYAYNMVTDHLFATFVGAFLMALLATARNLKIIGAALISIFLLSLFPVVAKLANQSAVENANSVRAGVSPRPRIGFVFRTDSKGNDVMSKDLIKDNNDHVLHLILETKDRFYVLSQIYDLGDKEMSEGTVYSVAKSDVLVTSVRLDSVTVDKLPRDGGIE